MKNLFNFNGFLNLNYMGGRLTPFLKRKLEFQVSRLLFCNVMGSKRLRPAVATVAIILASFLKLAASEINVFAAASLADALKEISSHYQKETGVRIVLSLGASSTLARQIKEGAPADIFFSADERRMNELETEGLIIKESRKSRLSNSLVIVVSIHNGLNITSPKDLVSPKIKRIALGDPKAVPIGIYAKEYLEGIGLWNQLTRKIVPTENVRAALAAVEAGNADASMVYKTDAAISKKVKIAFEINPEKAPRISYSLALVKSTRKPEEAQKFLNHLLSDDAGKIFSKYGFIVLRESK